MLLAGVKELGNLLGLPLTVCHCQVDALNCRICWPQPAHDRVATHMLLHLMYTLCGE